MDIKTQNKNIIIDIEKIVPFINIFHTLKLITFEQNKFINVC